MARIALVEDNPDNRMLINALLSGRFGLDEYEAGPEALLGMKACVPDLVLLDISLPGMSGTEVLAIMRAEPALASIPVIALTAHAMSNDRERLLSQGFNDYVTKPIVDENVLFASIDRLLQGRL